MLIISTNVHLIFQFSKCVMLFQLSQNPNEDFIVFQMRNAFPIEPKSKYSFFKLFKYEMLFQLSQNPNVVFKVFQMRNAFPNEPKSKCSF
jgi:hypothetical protein